MSEKYNSAKKELLYQWNKMKLRRIYRKDIADEYEGPIKVIENEAFTWVTFKSTSFGISRDDLTDINTWVHEMTEQAVSKTIPRVHEDIFRFSPYIHLMGKNIFEWFSPTIYHIIAALCTESLICNNVVTPDGFADYFRRNFKNFRYI